MNSMEKQEKHRENMSEQTVTRKEQGGKCQKNVIKYIYSALYESYTYHTRAAMFICMRGLIRVWAEERIS